MGLLSSTRFFPVQDVDLERLAQDVMAHFRADGYRVAGERTLAGAWHISLSKGNIFKMIAGMSTALKLDLERSPGGVTAKTSVGLFGQQAVPTALSLVVYPPLVLAQVWGLVQQHKLDEAALMCVEQRLYASTAKSATSGARTATVQATIHEVTLRFCPKCGRRLESELRFCTTCGAPVPA